MSIAGRPVITLTTWEIRWISGQLEGRCSIRAIDEQDAVDAFHRDPASWGCPHENPFAWAVPVRRVAWPL